MIPKRAGAASVFPAYIRTLGDSMFVRAFPSPLVGRLLRVFVALCALLPATPRIVHAQWYVGGYLGANHTAAASVSIEQPSLGTSLENRDVTFVARPFQSPQYYGLRVGH